MKKHTDSPAAAFPETITFRSSCARPKSGVSLLNLFLTLLGYGGILWAMMTLYTPDCRKTYFLPAAGVLFLVAAGIQLLPRFSGKLTLGYLGLLLAFAFWKARRIVEGIQYIVNLVYQKAHNTDVVYFTIHTKNDLSGSVLLTCICIAGLLAVFLAFFTMRKPHFVLTASVTFLLIEPGLYFGLPVSVFAMALLLAYWCGMLAMRFSMLGSQEKNRLFRKNASFSGAVTALFVLAVYTAVSLTGTWQGYTRPETDKQRRQDISDTLADFDIQNLPQSLRNLGTALGLSSSDRVTLGTKAKQRYRDRTDLKLTFDTLPDETMYLKGYTGSIYSDNSWRTLSRNADYQNADVVFSVLQSYDCAPQNFPFLFQRSILPDSDTFSCTVQPQRRDGRYYQPYVSFGAQVSFLDDASVKPAKRSSYSWTVSAPQTWALSSIDAHELHSETIRAAGPDDSTAVTSFLNALHIDGTNVNVSARFSSSEVADSPEMIQGKVIPAVLMESLAYRDFAKDAYTDLPDSDDLDEVYAALPESLQNSKPSTPAEQYETLCAIRSWMAERTTYTLAPGKTPRTRDFVNFFLLENQKGYCVHYATAGTILARHLGIPARYCEGYLVGEDILDSASVDSDGYTVELKDRQAHAWCEFYVDGYGWVPFEMTPGYYDSTKVGDVEVADSTEPPTNTTQETTMDAAASNVVSTEMTSASVTSAVSSGESTASETEPIPGGTEPDPNGGGLFGNTGSAANLVRLFIHIFLWLLLAAVLTAAVILLRRWHIQRRRRIFLDTLHPRQAVFAMYRYLFRLLRWTGLRFENEPLLEFCETAVRHLRQKDLPADAPEIIIPMTLALDFGKQFPEKDVQRKAAASVEELANAICASCKPFRRFCMKYILHLC